MQETFEVFFNLSYLILIISLGLKILRKSGGSKYFKLFGFMALILGFGDAFHLIPRIYYHFTSGAEELVFALGFGTLVASITMTIFYIIFYEAWKVRYKINTAKILDVIVYILGITRVLILLCPRNEWFIHESSLAWAIFRNIPFTLMGLLIIFMFYKKAAEYGDRDYKLISIAVFLSFAFYLPVAIGSSFYPILGSLMIPKTLAYVWIIAIGYKQLKKYREGTAHKFVN